VYYFFDLHLQFKTTQVEEATIFFLVLKLNQQKICTIVYAFRADKNVKVLNSLISQAEFFLKLPHNTSGGILISV
jgi:hypothetical protein